MLVKKIFVGLLWFFVLQQSVSANVHTVGDISIHYSVINSAMITPEVAAQYGIKRSGQTGLVNISVMSEEKPVVANIFGHGQNLLGQLKPLAFKEIKEDKAIYYIATYTFSHDEAVSFDLQIQPHKQGLLIPLQFKQTLYRD